MTTIVVFDRFSWLHFLPVLDYSLHVYVLTSMREDITAHNEIRVLFIEWIVNKMHTYACDDIRIADCMVMRQCYVQKRNCTRIQCAIWFTHIAHRPHGTSNPRVFAKCVRVMNLNHIFIVANPKGVKRQRRLIIYKCTLLGRSRVPIRYAEGRKRFKRTTTKSTHSRKKKTRQ